MDIVAYSYRDVFYFIEMFGTWLCLFSCVFMKFHVILLICVDFHKLVTDQQTDGSKNVKTSYRFAWTHLKIFLFPCPSPGIFRFMSCAVSHFGGKFSIITKGGIKLRLCRQETKALSEKHSGLQDYTRKVIQWYSTQSILTH